MWLDPFEAQAEVETRAQAERRGGGRRSRACARLDTATAMTRDKADGPPRTRRRPAGDRQPGASFDAPENTIAAFELASAHGADAIQLDVQLARDGRPVIIRDAGLERTTDGMGAVRERTVRELKRLDAGAWRGPRFRGQRIQTLEEVLERFRDRLQFWIELPATSEPDADIEDRVVSLLEIYDVRERAVIQSSDHAVLARIRAMARDVRLGGVVVAPDPTGPAAEAGGRVCASAELVSRLGGRPRGSRPGVLRGRSTSGPGPAREIR